jgi:alcohol dehydrogenase
MRAAYYSNFEGPVSIEQLPDPEPSPGGVVIDVKASGLCLSDWHGWKGHDDDIQLPHVPGHELSGVIESIGRNVKRFQPGDRVTLPFVCGCGACRQCHSGNQQVCDRQFQPGFTHWGSFAQFVAIDYADTNLVALPESIDDVTAASLGCRFATAFRAVVDQGAVQAEQWVAVHGCGGVGLSAIMIARAMGARVIAIDISASALNLAGELGAEHVIDGSSPQTIEQEIRDLSGGGANVSLDAVGLTETSFNSIACLAKRGKHIQVGILPPDQSIARVPMGPVIANELEILGSHGMQAHRYPLMLEMIRNGDLQPGKLVHEKISLDEVPQRLTSMDSFDHVGVSVIDRF